jgi:arylsulfatase A-like enzyme
MIPGLTSVLLILFLLLPGCSRQQEWLPSHPDRPNLLLITLDTTRADELGCYGSPDVRTPHIDGLATQGVKFLHNVAPSQCTNPAHATILTGLYLARHQVYDNQTPLSDEAVTLAEILKAHGYATLAAVTARHLNPPNSGFGQGFDTYLTCKRMEMRAGKRTGKFLKNLKRVAGQPFFAWLHYFDPHGDYKPPPPFNRWYRPKDVWDTVPRTKRMECRFEKGQKVVDPDDVIPLYQGEISYVDAEVGKVLAALQEWGIADETLVVLVGDHGESLGEHGIYFCHAGMFEQVLHVPLLMRWPGHLPVGLEVETWTGSADILPTVLALMGIDIPNGDLSGLDLAPAFSHPDTVLHDVLYSESYAGLIRAVYTAEGLKLIKLYEKDWSMVGDRLYRLSADPLEEQNLLAAEPEPTARLEALLDSWLAAARQRALPAVEDYQLDKETAEALRSLGYVE